MKNAPPYVILKKRPFKIQILIYGEFAKTLIMHTERQRFNVWILVERQEIKNVKIVLKDLVR